MGFSSSSIRSFTLNQFFISEKPRVCVHAERRALRVCAFAFYEPSQQLPAVAINAAAASTIRLAPLCEPYLSGVSKQDAQVALKGTTSGDKNELLFSRFDTNYNEIPQRFRKGTTLFRARPTAVVAPPQPQPPPPPEKPSRQATRQDGAAAVDGSGDKGGREPPREGGPVSAGQQAGGTGVEAPRYAPQETNNIGVETIPDSRPSEDGKPEDGKSEVGTEGEDAQAVEAAPGNAARKGQSDKRPVERGKANASEKPGGAPRGDAVVKVVSCSDGKGRAKRLLKKGHAPPGAIEEDACDLIRDDFWDRNPHILAAGTMRR